MKKQRKNIFYRVLSVILLSIFILIVARELLIKKEVEAAVGKVIERIPESSRLGDPTMEILKGQLRDLKRVYFGYSCEQLLEMMDTIETEDDYYRLLEQGISRFTYPAIAGTVILAAVCAGVIGYKVAEKYINDKQREDVI